MKVKFEIEIEVFDLSDAPMMLVQHVGEIGSDESGRADMAVSLPAPMTWKISGPDKVAVFSVQDVIKAAASEVL